MREVVSVSRSVAATSGTVWAMVSDLPRMGEWSPENRGGRWLGGATGPAAGAKFRGHNRNGWRRWSTTVVVTECVEPSRFVFSQELLGRTFAEWRFEIVPHPSGCLVTQSWVDRRNRLIDLVGVLVTGVADRAAHNRAGMEATLAALSRAAGEPSARGVAGDEGDAPDPHRGV